MDGGHRIAQMASRDYSDLLTWILIEAYKNGTTEPGRAIDAREPAPGILGSYCVSRQTIHQKYFGLPKNPQSGPSDPSQAPAAHHLARLKNAAILARSVKRLLEQRLIVPPNLGGLKTGVRHILSIYADYIFLTEQGIQEAKAFLSNP